MFRQAVPYLLSTLVVLPSWSQEPPVAEQRPFDVVSPHGTRNDPYYWLRDDTRSQPEVLDHLRAEQAYFERRGAAFAGLTDAVEREILGRLKQDDSSVPFTKKDYVYYVRFETGKQHPIYARRPAGTAEGEGEQILVDANREAEGKNFYRVGNWEVSPDQKLVAFLEDTRGRSQNALRVREIATGRDLPERIEGLSYSLAWAADSRTLYYVENDPETLLTTRVKKHALGTDSRVDPVIYEEKDTSFYLGVGATGDEKYVVVALSSTVSSESWAIAADDPESRMKVLAPRERDVRYAADHIGERWIVRTDWQAPNYRLMSVEDGEIGDRSRWRELVPHDPAVFVQSFALFRDFLVVNERSESLLRLRVLPWAAPAKSFFIRSDEPAYTMRFAVNAEQETDRLRYVYTSLTTPATTYEVDMKSGERVLLKRDPVIGYQPEGYVTDRLWAPARDGVRIPVTVLHRRGFAREGTAPVLQVGYGSYGASSDPYFSSAAISLVDRGFLYAIAHVRGGQEMGRAWWEDGRLLEKRNTFTDFVDVTDFLVGEKWAAKEKVAAMGGSAGGLLMGAVANLAPDRYRAMVAHVPFVDVVTTMLDDKIPLTSNEFDEWGDPKQKAYYDYMLSYSPYDNVEAKEYPALLVTTGLHDSQVQYFEPAKWVAKLRATKKGDSTLLFKVNMGAGHGGRSGRFERIRETAEAYAFLLHELGFSD
jgi:oligopeptidase B